MGKFTRIGNRLRRTDSGPTPPQDVFSSKFGELLSKAGLGSGRHHDRFAPLPYPTPSAQTSPIDSTPETKPLFSRDRLIAASIGAVAATSVCLLGFGLFGGSGETVPQPVAAHSAPDAAPREAAPQPAPLAQVPVEEPADALAPPAEPAPAEFVEPPLAPPVEPAPAPMAEPVPAPPAEPAPAPIAEPVPAPQAVEEYVPPAAAVSYANCTEAKAAGAAPIYEGSPGYAKKLDRDGDGIACDK